MTEDVAQAAELPIGFPDPENGWSRTISTYRGAVVYPARGAALRQRAGVLDAAGNYVATAAHWRYQRPLTLRPRAIRPREIGDLPGRWLWAGSLVSHFGHFLTESTTRIWALDHIRRSFDGIIFIPKSRPVPESLANWQTEFMKLMGIDLPVRIITRPTRVDRLVVPGQGFGLGTISAGTPEMRAMMARRFAPDVEGSGGPRLYISRSGLGLRGSMILGETDLEAGLAAQGYDILHPQDHSISDQIARMRGAQQIVVADGSAAHLLGFVARADQQIAYVLRRRHWIEAPLAQLAQFSGRSPLVVDALKRFWVQKARPENGHLTFGELDLPKLQAILTAEGFLAPAPCWPKHSKAEMHKALDGIGLGDDFISIAA